MASNKPQQILLLRPSNEIVIEDPFDHAVTSYLELFNPSDQRVCFKLKTTGPRRYCVKPNSGLVDAGCKMRIAIMLKPSEHEPGAAQVKAMARARPRPIKFHEYKGPPTAKRHQQTPQPVAPGATAARSQQRGAGNNRVLSGAATGLSHSHSHSHSLSHKASLSHRPSPSPSHSLTHSLAHSHGLSLSLGHRQAHPQQQQLQLQLQQAPQPQLPQVQQMEHVVSAARIGTANMTSGQYDKYAHNELNYEDELLFSEFIDLQDVPLNVDESDWLKKFLPPCPMS